MTPECFARFSVCLEYKPSGTSPAWDAGCARYYCLMLADVPDAACDTLSKAIGTAFKFPARTLRDNRGMAAHQHRPPRPESRRTRRENDSPAPGEGLVPEAHPERPRLPLGDVRTALDGPDLRPYLAGDGRVVRVLQ